MAKNGYSRNTLTGRVNHYDRNGNKTGYSRRGLSDNTWVHYDKNGHRVSVTRKSLIGGTYTTDTHGKIIGRSRKNLTGSTNYYDAHGKLVGRSYDNLVGGSRDSEGFANQTSTRPAERMTYNASDIADDEYDLSGSSTTGTNIGCCVALIIFIAITIFIGVALERL